MGIKGGSVAVDVPNDLQQLASNQETNKNYKKENQQMLEMKITTKQQLMKLLAGSDVKMVVAMDIENPEDLNELKKAGLKMLRTKPVTAFLVAN